MRQNLWKQASSLETFQTIAQSAMHTTKYDLVHFIASDIENRILINTKAGHAMELSDGSENQLWNCDLCGRHSVDGEKVQAWRCLQDIRSGGGCDFDICTRCIEEYKVS